MRKSTSFPFRRGLSKIAKKVSSETHLGDRQDKQKPSLPLRDVYSPWNKVGNASLYMS